MEIFNSLIEFMNKETVKEYNDFTKQYADALEQWISKRYNPRFLIPMENELLFKKNDDSFREFKLISSRKNPTFSNLNFTQKKFIVNHRQEIIDCYNIFNHNLNIYKSFKSLNYLYPLGVRYIAQKYLRIGLDNSTSIEENREIQSFFEDNDDLDPVLSYIKSFDDLKINQKESLLFYQEEARSIVDEINECIKLSKIANKAIETITNFEKLISSRKLRSKYYEEFLASRNIKSNKEEYCLEHLEELDTFISNLLEHEYNELKLKYPKGVSDYDLMNQDREGDNLSGVEYWFHCICSEDDIRNLHMINLKYDCLNEKYPNGVAAYEEDNKQFDDNAWRYVYPSHADVVSLGEEKIAHFEKISKDLSAYKKWMKSQKEFSKYNRNLKDKILPEWGCYNYNIPVEQPSCGKNPYILNYEIWQHFYSTCCSENDLDYTDFNYCKQNNECLRKELIGRTCKYIPQVFDDVISFIQNVQKDYDDVLVLLGDSDIDIQAFNEYHFDYLMKKFDSLHMSYSKNPMDVRIDHLFTHIIMVEMITTNGSLMKKMSNILSKYKDKMPYIIILSLLKEYDRNEMLEIINNRKLEKEKEKNEEEQKLKKLAEQEKEERERRLAKEQEIVRLQDSVSKWLSPTQTELKCFSMFYYYPTTCEFEADEDEWNIRNLIWNFKASPNKPMSDSMITTLHKSAMYQIVEKMYYCLTSFFGDDLSKLTLVCIPSSKQIVTQRRYEDFSIEICKRTGMENAYEHVRVVVDGDAKHTGGISTAKYAMDDDFFKGKYILLFDDVITSGKSMQRFKYHLEKIGAVVIGGFSIGQTMHHRQPIQPIDTVTRFKS